MKKVIALLLAVVTALTLCLPASAAGSDAKASADALHELGLFEGVGTDKNGNPIYELDRVPSRQEAITMLVRLLGKEDEAKAGTWTTPFTDVEKWAKPYVGYAYANGLTNGVGKTLFGSSEAVSETQYLTFILRALGYSDKNGDFSWDKAKILTDEIGITSARGKTSEFTRGSVVEVSYNALSASVKGTGKTLINTLYEAGAVAVNKIPALEKTADTSEIPFGNAKLNAYLLSLNPEYIELSGQSKNRGFVYYKGITAYDKIVTYFSKADYFTSISDETTKAASYKSKKAYVEITEDNDTINYFVGKYNGDGTMTFRECTFNPNVSKQSDAAAASVDFGNSQINEYLLSLKPVRIEAVGNEQYHLYYDSLTVYGTICAHLGSQKGIIKKAEDECTLTGAIAGTMVRVEIAADNGGVLYSIAKFPGNNTVTIKNYHI